MKDIKIYGLFNPEEPKVIRYIGKTKMSIRRRLQAHIDEAKTSGRKYLKRTHKINWINSLLNKGIRPQVVLLDTCSKEDWPQLEKEYIAKYRELFSLTNESDGGYGGGIGITHSVIQYTQDGMFVKVHNSIEDACSELNIERGVINSALQRNSLGGFGGGSIWRYYTNKYPQYVPPYFEQKLIVRIKDITTGECRVFLTLKEGLDYFGLKRCGAICRCINEKVIYKERYSIIAIDKYNEGN